MLKRTDGYTDKRYYFDTETGKFYISATSFCSSVLPENPYLVKWKQSLGEFEANRQSKLAAHYGTCMHICAEEFLSRESYTFNMMHMRMLEYMNENNIDEDLESRWLKDLTNDMLAFAQFCFEKEVDPINIELWAKKDITEAGGIAGTIDLECNLKFGRSKVHAIVDLKSGRKGFYDAHILQLHLYNMVVPVDMLFNWSPTEWKGDTPTYKFVNQTKSNMATKLKHYIELAKLDGMFTPKVGKLSFSTLKRGEKPVFRVLGLDDLRTELNEAI